MKDIWKFPETKHSTLSIPASAFQLGGVLGFRQLMSMLA
jgi:hypothetical protein